MHVAFRMIVCFLVVSSGSIAFAEITPRIEVIKSPEDSRSYEFPSIPAPSAKDAAGAATVTVLSGRLDSNSSGVSAINDGELPENSDQPSRNFFFAPGTRSGRLLIEFKEPIEIQQINSYSWHDDVRAPQVYRVYGDAADSERKPPAGRRGTPESAGWQLIASVDTRSNEEKGGQQGVSIVGDDTNPIGRHKRLLFDISRTEDEDEWGLTFFSEIDVIDGREYEPRPQVRELLTVMTADQQKIIFETTETPDLKPWVETTLAPICIEWYPKIVAMFPSDGYTAPQEFTVTFHHAMDGVAYCAGRDVHCAGPWFRQNLDGEAAGAVVHEMVHVVQQFGRGRGGERNPGWLVEGLADYVRWCLYEPKEKRPKPDPATAKYTDSYRTTGAFLAWVAESKGEDVLRTLNAAMREGDYSPHLWERSAGATVDDLWADYVKTLQSP